jgi:ribose transport system permease protein
MSEVQVAPRRRINLGFDRFSGLYVWAALIIVFSLWIPDLFLQVSTLKQILSFQAIAAIVALGLIVPIAST